MSSHAQKQQNNGSPVAPSSPPPAMTGNPTMDILNQNQYLIQQLHRQQQQLADLYRLSLQAKSSPNSDSPMPGWQWPSQQIAGKIKYPELQVYPFLWGYVELTETGVVGGPAYSTTGGLCSCNIQVSDIYSFVCAVAYRLRRLTAPDGSPLPTNCWLPMGCKYHPFVSAGNVYIGKDFQQRIQSDADGIYWQGLGTRFRSSNECDVNGIFWLGEEYEAKPREVFTLEAIPLAPPVVDDTYILEGALIGYEMRHVGR